MVESAWTSVKETGAAKVAAYGASRKIELSEELEQAEKSESFLEEAIAEGHRQISSLRAQLSLPVCQKAQPLFRVQIAVILNALHAINQANIELERLRNAIHDAGTESGSLAPCTYTAGGKWGDPSGSAVDFYRKHIATFYPELKKEVWALSKQNRRKPHIYCAWGCG